MKTNLTKLAKNLRQNNTDAEKLLWGHLCAKKLNGLKFRRQAPIGRYIADFVCFAKKIIIELDGGQHAEEQYKIRDQQRDIWLQSQGFTIIRFWNNDVITNIEGVWEKILETLEHILTPPSPNPSHQGRGKE